MGILPGNFVRMRTDSAARCSNVFVSLKDVPDLGPRGNMEYLGEVWMTLLGVTFGVAGWMRECGY